MLGVCRNVLVQAAVNAGEKSPVYARDDMLQILSPSLFHHRLRIALKFTLW